MNALPPPAKPRRDLGPKQIEWCRKNLAHFKRSQDQAKAAKVATEKARKRAGVGS